MPDASEQPTPVEWTEGIDPNQPLSELIEPSWLEPLTFSPEELAYLEEQGQECAQELFENGMIPDIPAIDTQEYVLQRDALPDLDSDFGR